MIDLLGGTMKELLAKAKESLTLHEHKHPMDAWFIHEHARQTVIRFLGRNPYNPGNVVTWRKSGREMYIELEQAREGMKSWDSTGKQE